MTIKAENTSVGLAVLLLDGLGVKGAQKRGAAIALVDLMGSVVREEMAAAQREAFERADDDSEGFADASEGTADPVAAARLARLLARGES